MAIEELIFSRLSGFAALSALVGARIYPGDMPQNVVMPAISYRRVTDETPQPQQVVGATDLIRAHFQFDCWGKDYDSARDVRLQLRAALKRWSTTGPPVVQVIFALAEVDLGREPDTGLRHLVADYEINYEE